MESTTPSGKVSRGARAILVALFFTLLWLPSLESVFRWDTRLRVNEHRFAAPFPRLLSPPSPGSLKEFTMGFGRYFNDHFGFRRRLIYWSQAWKRKLFPENWEFHVVLGRDRWMYATWSSDPMTEYENVTRPFTAERLRDWQTLFEARRAWLRQRGIPYLVIIPPDKQTACPEYLPDGKGPLGSGLKLDQFMAYMKSHSDVEILDLRHALEEGKKEKRTFHLTDSHWNQYGAFFAAQAVMQSLSKQVPGLGPLSLKSFDVKIQDGAPGNLGWMLTGGFNIVEPDCPTFSSRAPLPPLRPLERMEDGARILNAQGQGKVVIFGDSFAEGLLPFLALQFNETMYYRLYNEEHNPSVNLYEGHHAHIWRPELIKREKPTVVIDEILNSLIYLENPAEIMRVDSLK